MKKKNVVKLLSIFAMASGLVACNNGESPATPTPSNNRPQKRNQANSRRTRPRHQLASQPARQKNLMTFLQILKMIRFRPRLLMFRLKRLWPKERKPVVIMML